MPIGLSWVGVHHKNSLSGILRCLLIRRDIITDPHPQISPKGNFVVYTTTVRGKVDVAVTPIVDILAKI